MRLHAIEVHNWACIEALSLTELGAGIIVLHGPNRTGKSSLVQAIRSGLFDHFHDSQESTILAAVPWKTKAAPRVTIEFEQAGQRYRIGKTFAKTKEGQATLEQHSASGWSVLERGKDASKRVRDLFGIDSSSAGIFQMLWLGQRDFELPTPRTLDPTLAKALEAVLGTLITGRDIDFKARLDKACERWFTVKTMKDRKDSPVTKLSAELEKASARKIEIDRQWAEAETALTQYGDALARQPELKRTLAEADQELKDVQKERESITARKGQHELALKNQDAEARQLKQAQLRLRDWDDDEKKFGVAEKTLADARLQEQIATAKLQQVDAESARARLQVEQAERERAAHQQTRSALDDRQQLLNLAVQCQTLDGNLEQAQECLNSLPDLEAKLTGPAVFNEKQIEALRQNRHEATRLRAQLEAGEIQVVLQARQPLLGAIELDGQPGAGLSLPANGETNWLLRQHAELTLGDWATVRIGRVKEDRDLEQIARRLTELERDYRQALTAAKIDPDLPTPVDALVERRLEHEARTKDLQRFRDVLAKTAPKGMPALVAQRGNLRDQQDAILARRPDLRDWTPNQPHLDQHRDEFDRRAKELQTNVEKAKAASTQGEQSAQLEQAAHQKIKTLIATQTVEVRNLKGKLGQHERAALLTAVSQAEARWKEANANVQETTLSAAEQAIESRHQTAVNAQNQRSQRLRDNQDLLLRLQTQLAGAEGLHTKRNQADQAVNDLTRELARERLHAMAHKHLKELFEQVRQEQVRRTVGPINDRVMTWANQLGLSDYTRLDFDDQLLPGALVPSHAADGAAVEWERESYGTLEQLSLLVRLAVGGLLAKNEAAVAILDDPLAHADLGKHRKMLEILDRAARGEPYGPHPTGPLQLIILTCHAERFDYLSDAQHFDLAKLIQRGG